MILTLIETSCKKLHHIDADLEQHELCNNLERIHVIYIIHMYVLLVPLHMICDERLLNRTMINYSGNKLIKKLYFNIEFLV